MNDPTITTTHNGRLPVDPFATQQPRKLKTKRLYRVDDILRLSDPNWLVKDQFTEGSLVCVYGDSGSCKSFLTLDWSLSVASGKPWLGVYDVLPLPVLYIYSEGFLGLKKRLLAWQAEYGPIDANNIVFDRKQNNFCEWSQAEAILNDAKELFGQYPRLIVVDTLSRNFVGDENGNEMKSYVRTIEEMKKLSNATVVSVHHQGKDKAKGLRGHTSLKAALDTIIHVEINRSQTQITIDCEKQKDFEPFETYKLNKKVLEVGENISSCVLNLNNPWATRFQLLTKEIKFTFESLVSKFGDSEFESRDANKTITGSEATVRRHLAALRNKGFIKSEKKGHYNINKNAMVVYQAI